MTRSHDYENIPDEGVFVDTFDEDDFEDDRFVYKEDIQDGCEYTDNTSDDDLTDSPFTFVEDKTNSLVETIHEDEHRHKIENPDFMTYIRKAIPMPSVQEMNACWEEVLKADRDSKAIDFAYLFLKRWVSRWLESKQKRQELAYQQNRSRQLLIWKKIKVFLPVSNS